MRNVTEKKQKKPDLPTRNLRCPRCGRTSPVPDGDFIRRSREDRGLSLREVARCVGISASYLSDLERNNRTLGNPVLEKMRRYLNV